MTIVQSCFGAIIFILIVIKYLYAIEPITSIAGVGVVVAAAGSLVVPIGCRFRECCTDESGFFAGKRWIKRDQASLDNLSVNLVNRLHGQPLARDLLYKSVASHVKNDNPPKPLVLSLHGWTGSGKNYASNLIVESLYELGGDSDYVHYMSGMDSFLEASKVDTYKVYINNFLKDNLKKCGRQLFIIDEVDKIPPGIMDAFIPFFGHSITHTIKDANKAIYLILSNAGGSAIAQETYKFYQRGKNRKDISLKDLESAINLSAFNEKGGLWRSHVIEKHLIDFFVPFLPLERHHVRSCIVDRLRDRYNRTSSVDDELISEELEYYPLDTKIYSKSGCKKIARKVDMML
ncbi:torsin-1A-like isoform X2 [Brevipalpus obovatus]|uniref:torsin-1A-like isoform X2 n=1 Tax=Brevipalpus obovatus TaxID=246614 RepID=UPI003D9E2F8D